MSETSASQHRTWDRRKKDRAPRGVFRHRSGVWAARFTCGGGHIHQERVGPLKSDAIRVYHERRASALDAPGWCPAVERRDARDRARLEAERARRRVTFREYAVDYLAWARTHHRSFNTTASQVASLCRLLGEQMLDAITQEDIERVLTWVREGQGRLRSGATVNRYRDRLSGLFARARRLGLVSANPVTGMEKFKEPGGRLVYLPPEGDEERALCEALEPAHRPPFTISVNTGLRWSEQMTLRWRDVDLLTGLITVPRSKNGYSRRVPMNSVVRAVLVDLATRRERTDGSAEFVFPVRPTRPDAFFPKAVERAQAALRAPGKDASQLDGYTWHGNRHTFASRLVMAGVDLRAVQELGGWRSLSMVQRYAHLSPSHLLAAVERLVTAPTAASTREPGAGPTGTVELRRNFDSGHEVPAGQIASGCYSEGLRGQPV